jgi:hypothetical protein
MRQIKMNKAEKLDGIVADYINEHRERAAKELRWFAIQRILEAGCAQFCAQRRTRNGPGDGVGLSDASCPRSNLYRTCRIRSAQVPLEWTSPTQRQAYNLAFTRL